MSEETLFALIDADGVVSTILVAEQEIIDVLSEQLADPDINTPDIPFTKAVDVTGRDVRIGDKLGTNGKFVRPAPPALTPEQVASREAGAAAEEQLSRDNDRLLSLREKVGVGKPGLTQAERDEFNLIMATRNL